VKPAEKKIRIPTLKGSNVNRIKFTFNPFRVDAKIN